MGKRLTHGKNRIPQIRRTGSRQRTNLPDADIPRGDTVNPALVLSRMARRQTVAGRNHLQDTIGQADAVDGIQQSRNIVIAAGADNDHPHRPKKGIRRIEHARDREIFVRDVSPLKGQRGIGAVAVLLLAS